MLITERQYRVCDRCGDRITVCIFDVIKLRAERPLINGSIIRKDIDVGEGKPYPVIEFDLCSRCADGFKYWLNEKTKCEAKTDD